MPEVIRTAVYWVFLAVGLVAFVVELWALLVAVRAPAAAYRAAGKQSKVVWVALTVAAVVVGLSSLPVVGSGRGFGGLLSVAAVVVAFVFLASVRPLLTERRPPPPRQTGGW